MQLMPLVHEMPRGDVGIRLTRQAVNIVVMGMSSELAPAAVPMSDTAKRIDKGFASELAAILCQMVSSQPKGLASAGIAIAVYGLIGVFGAARYGLATEGDLLVNSWLHGRAEGVLDVVLVAYLAISIPPIQVRWPPRSHTGAPITSPGMKILLHACAHASAFALLDATCDKGSIH